MTERGLDCRSPQQRWSNEWPARSTDDTIFSTLLLAGFIPLKSQHQEENRNNT